MQRLIFCFCIALILYLLFFDEVTENYDTTTPPGNSNSSTANIVNMSTNGESSFVIKANADFIPGDLIYECIQNGVDTCIDRIKPNTIIEKTEISGEHPETSILIKAITDIKKGDRVIIANSKLASSPEQEKLTTKKIIADAIIAKGTEIFF